VPPRWHAARNTPHIALQVQRAGDIDWAVWNCSMFQEWLLVALKLLLIICVIALVVALLLMRVACARIAAQTSEHELQLIPQRPSRKASRLAHQRGV
jgi:uncharacterized membrane protein